MNKGPWHIIDEDIAFLGLPLGLFLIIISLVLTFNNKEYNKLIKECEKSLPRDKHCIIIAVPVEDNEK